jgi:hypothetical protein
MRSGKQSKVLTEDEARRIASNLAKGIDSSASVGAPLPLRKTVRTTMMARTKTIPMIAYIGIAALLTAATSPTAAQDVQVQSVVAIDGKVVCLQMKAGATHPCEGFTPPPKLAVGETFSADGNARQIGVILAHQAEDELKPYGITKGEWICVAAETLEDLPVNQIGDGTWLRILRCQPELAGKAPPPPPE